MRALVLRVTRPGKRWLSAMRQRRVDVGTRRTGAPHTTDDLVQRLREAGL